MATFLIFQYSTTFLQFKVFESFKKIEKMFLVKKYFQIRNQRVRISILHMKNRKSIFLPKTRFLPDYSLVCFRVFGQKIN